jgi:hypothetical protein
VASASSPAAICTTSKSCDADRVVIEAVRDTLDIAVRRDAADTPFLNFTITRPGT